MIALLIGSMFLSVGLGMVVEFADHLWLRTLGVTLVGLSIPLINSWWQQ